MKPSPTPTADAKPIAPGHTSLSNLFLAVDSSLCFQGHSPERRIIEALQHLQRLGRATDKLAADNERLLNWCKLVECRCHDNGVMENLSPHEVKELRAAIAQCEGGEKP